jgi:hypothetical protein
MHPLRAVLAVVALATGCAKEAPAPAQVTESVSDIPAAVLPVSLPHAAAEATPCEKPIGILADYLVAQYKQNSVRADLTFKGKLLAFAGYIDAIESGVGDAPVMTVGGVRLRGMSQQAAAAKNRGDIFVALVRSTGCDIFQTPTVEFVGVSDPGGPRCGVTRDDLRIALCAAYPDISGCKAPPAEPSVAPAAAPVKPAAIARKPKRVTAERLELPCRPGQPPPCYD